MLESTIVLYVGDFSMYVKWFDSLKICNPLLSKIMGPTSHANNSRRNLPYGGKVRCGERGGSRRV